ncbi:thiamine pyrophosphokinase [Hoeflea marina]|uniref:Thiamine diphosphokinase n=1 Tax=Hoeflea marina TaxID=274592 RepID=A0A317PER0_9HYPH|nr:thiamine diphosphokinase [Hoeflea marina]PWV98188.1 thiamine pyrophosphokinase [Hoeflea marina]
MEKISTFAILLGGGLKVDARVTALVAGARAIAADGGIGHAAALGLVPELWVGDFDSVTPELEAAWSAVPRQAFPAAKDLTDGEIAINEAISRGARRLIMIGALAGERSDHALVHMLQAVTLAERGFEVVLSSGEEEAVPVLAGVTRLSLPGGSLFSILALSDLVDLGIAGARYPLDRVQIPFGSSRTLSNAATGDVAIQLKAGRGLLISRPHDFSGV